MAGKVLMLFLVLAFSATNSNMSHDLRKGLDETCRVVFPCFQTKIASRNSTLLPRAGTYLDPKFMLKFRRLLKSQVDARMQSRDRVENQLGFIGRND